MQKYLGEKGLGFTTATAPPGRKILLGSLKRVLCFYHIRVCVLLCCFFGSFFWMVYHSLLTIPLILLTYLPTSYLPTYTYIILTPGLHSCMQRYHIFFPSHPLHLCRLLSSSLLPLSLLNAVLFLGDEPELVVVMAGTGPAELNFVFLRLNSRVGVGSGLSAAVITVAELLLLSMLLLLNPVIYQKKKPSLRHQISMHPVAGVCMYVCVYVCVCV
ncbi:hypothetical protein EDC01DRAFT_372901 [Geopyxis carbonaria]|nr:hypothetical protein EDC01DRAFT_372901 [Geopyxis carbonaria]